MQFHEGTQSSSQREEKEQASSHGHHLWTNWTPRDCTWQHSCTILHRSHVQLLVQCIHCGKSDKDVHRCILDEIRKLGDMDLLVSDRAQAQISKKVHDVLHTFGIHGQTL